MEEYYLNTTRRGLSMPISLIFKTIIFATLLFIDWNLFGQSFVIGEPQGILDKLLTDYKQTEQIGDNIIIDVEIKQKNDTTIFCIGVFKEVSDIFLCLPSAVYKHGNNYVFVKTGSENYFSFNEDYIRFIYSLSAQFARQNYIVTSYSPFDYEYTDEVLQFEGDTSSYEWYWYYVINYNTINVIRTDRSLYSTCWYGGE